MTHLPRNFTVWTEIPVSDLDRGIAFYSAVFDIEIARDETGPNPMAIFPTEGNAGVAGHLYEGKPAPEGTGATVHFAVPDTLEAACERVKAAGGTVLSDPIAIPMGRFAYAIDPDGNSVGLFQA